MRKRKIFNACQFLIMDACLSLNPLLTDVYLNTNMKTAVQRRTAEKNSLHWLWSQSIKISNPFYHEI